MKKASCNMYDMSQFLVLKLRKYSHKHKKAIWMVTHAYLNFFWRGRELFFTLGTSRLLKFVIKNKLNRRAAIIQWGYSWVLKPHYLSLNPSSALPLMISGALVGSKILQFSCHKEANEQDFLSCINIVYQMKEKPVKHRIQMCRIM